MSNYEFKLGYLYSKTLDRGDPLQSYRERFYPIEGAIYMDGNSLGLCSKDAEESLLEVLEDWKKNGIGIWDIKDSKYFHYSKNLGNQMATLIGARKNEICLMGNTTLCIHQALATLYKPTDQKFKILVDGLNFPTDRYAVESQVRLKGYEVEEAIKTVKSKDERWLKEEDIIEAMTEDVALILLPSVFYRSSQLLDMKKVTKAAHERGILIGWDLCHSIGAVPHHFEEFEPDFAVWCTYKYLSGGPGSTAGLYINQRHFNTPVGLAGWFGNKDETQFQLKQTYEQSNDASAWQTGTPSLLSMATLEGTLKIYQEAGLENIRKKSLEITAYFMYLIDYKLSKYGFTLGNPRDDEKRGGHICLEHKEAYRICLSLKENKIIPDFREPNVIRLAPIALYTSYEDVYHVVEVLEKIVINREYRKFSEERNLVV